MKALLLTAPGVLELADVPEPVAGDADVVVSIRAAGICGSDVHGMDGSSGRRVPPLVMGHEAAGVVERVGSAVRGWSPGDAVTFDSTVYCGECAFCVEGLVNLCDRRRVLGVSTGEYRRDGAFAERVVVPSRILHRVPAGVSMVEAALAEPLAVALHAVSRAPSAATGFALVIGAGVIGLLVVASLRAAGCERIVVVDLSPGRLARAMTMGATDVIPADSKDVAERLQALTGGRGPDVVFEAVGIPATVALGIESVRKGGTVVLVGNVAPAAELPLQWAVSRELSLLGSAASCGEFPEALERIASKQVDVGGLVSAVGSMADGAAWFERLREPGTDLLKVVLQPDPDHNPEA
jgi:L-iditol 2-dehydrogenase